MDLIVDFVWVKKETILNKYFFQYSQHLFGISSKSPIKLLVNRIYFTIKLVTAKRKKVFFYFFKFILKSLFICCHNLFAAPFSTAALWIPKITFSTWSIYAFNWFGILDCFFSLTNGKKRKSCVTEQIKLLKNYSCWNLKWLNWVICFGPSFSYPTSSQCS